jgi:AcrR family transcriptional regulator
MLPDPPTPSERRRRADGELTRQAIVHEAVSLSTVDGLEGLSIGNLAKALGMSKSGLYAHFGSKQELQLAAIDEATRIFQLEVVDPALAAPAGIEQLVVICDAFFDHLQRRTFPGGCFFAAASLEMGTRPGPVKERIVAFQNALGQLICQFAAVAIEQDQLPADEDPAQLAFELHGILLAADVNLVLSGTTKPLDTGRHSVRRRLGIDEASAPSVVAHRSSPGRPNGTKAGPPAKRAKAPARTR